MSLVLLATLLSGCATVPSDVIIVTRCPKLSAYEQRQLQRAAEEFERLPADSALAAMMTDYGKLRSACRKVNSLK